MPGQLGLTAFQAPPPSIGGSTGATDNAVLRADGTAGRTLQSSLMVVDDSGYISSFGGRITFPASDAGSGTNTLGDYEQGTWTPIDGSGAGLAITGTGLYTKIGRQVYASATATYPATADGSNATIGGLPFAGFNDAGARTGVLSFTTSAAAVKWLLNLNATTGLFFTAVGGLVTNAQMSTALSFINADYPT